MMNEEKSTLRLFESEKLVVFSKPKVATRFLESMPFDDITGGVHFNWDGNICYNDCTPKVNHGYEDIFSKSKNKKDIIFLYRNPRERFITGFIQSTVISYLDSPTTLSIAFPEIQNFRNSEINLFHGCKYILDRNYKFDSTSNGVSGYTFRRNKDNLLNECFRIFENLISRAVLSLSKVNIPYDIHTANYLMIYNSLLTKFDSNKVKLVNIDNRDNKLFDILSTYFENIRVPNSNNSNTKLKYLFKKWLSGSNTANSIIENYIRIDNYFYNQFEKSELNILNKPK